MNMTKEEMESRPRKNANELLPADTPMSIVLAVEVALNYEWWRGYHVGQGEALAAMDRALGAANA